MSKLLFVFLIFISSNKAWSILQDGYPAPNNKIHMVGGGNIGKPWLGFILNRNELEEDNLVLGGKYGAAFLIYESKHKAGDLSATHNLGLMYLRGLGVEKNISIGMLFLEESMKNINHFNTANVFYLKAKEEQFQIQSRNQNKDTGRLSVADAKNEVGYEGRSNLPYCPQPGNFFKNCFGIVVNIWTGRVYIGEIKDDKPNGMGRLYEDRKGGGNLISEGVWENGNFIRATKLNQGDLTAVEAKLRASQIGNVNGLGAFTFSDGRKYVGQIKYGSFDGEGVMYDPYGKIISRGVWKDNILINQEATSVQPSGQVSSSAKVTLDLTDAKTKRTEATHQQPTPQLPATSTPAFLGKRIALVVGNANYRVRPLVNARNDADDMSRALKGSGFEVIDLRDGSLSQMRTAVRQFGDKLLTNDVGLVYYSGHGIEVKGRNYLIPVNADIKREDEIADQGLDVALILEKMNTAERSVNIMIVDACRDDPFGRSFRSISRGLAAMEAPRGTIIAYATSPGKVASDGDPIERNSPYTKHLLRAMQAPNKPIEQVFKEVRRAVQVETKNQQTPWENTSLSGDFYFKVTR